MSAPAGPTDELGDAIATLTGAASGLVAAGSQTSDPCCCAGLVVTALTGIDTMLQAIAAIMGSWTPGSATGAVDLTTVNAQLTAIAGTLASFPTTPTADGNNITAAINQVAPALNAAAPANLQPLVTALQNLAATLVPPGTAPGAAPSALIASLFGTLDVPQSLYQQLETDGYIPAGYAALLAPGGVGPGSVAGAWGAVKNTVEGWLASIGTDVESVATAAKPYITSAITWFESTYATITAAEDSTLEPIIEGMVNALTSYLNPVTTPVPGNSGADSWGALTRVVTLLLNINAASVIVDLLRPGAGASIRKYADTGLSMMEYQELASIKIGPMITYGAGRDSEHAAKALFMQELPHNNEMAAQAARGIITAAAAQAVMKMNGLDPSFQTPAITAAQSGLNPRQLIQLLPSGLLSAADITSELTFNGVRPQSQSLFQLVAPWLATKTARDAYIAALEQAYVFGLYADADYQNLVASAEQNTTLSSLQLLTVQVKALTEQTKELAASYYPLYQSGLMTQAGLQAALEGLQIQPNWVTAIMAKQEALAEARLQRQAISAANKLANLTTNVERKTLLANFKAGSINSATYAAGLVGTGLTVVQAAAWADLAALWLQGNLTWLYGVVMPRPQAQITQAQVNAILGQVSSGLISAATAASELQTLNVPATWINALIAKAAASATSKTLAYLYPVTPS